jgi:NAD(P)-dependent dehydrogenase (short-subunit alcohol dehydrogenase family)
MDFRDKVALVTGAAGGIGSAAALRFASLGADVHLVDLDAGGLERVAGEIVAATGRSATTSSADVTKDDDVRAYVAAAVDAHGRIDAFFNNAGIEGPVAPITEYPVAAFEQVIAVNLVGVFLGLHHVLPVMLGQGSGAIVNTGSLASERGLAGTSGYNAAKHAVIGLTRTAAAEVAGRGVRVNAVLPGMIDTRMLRALAGVMMGDVERGVAFMTANAPIARAGEAAEVAAVVAFLCSDDASFVHGVGWPVDGGALATMANPTAD